MNSRNLASGASPLRVLGAMLRHYRTSAGLSQEQLGALLYCSADLVGKIENGQRVPSEQFVTAADALSELKTGDAYQDTASRGQIIEDADDLAAISLLWDTLNAEALPRSRSVDLLEEVAKTWT